MAKQFGMRASSDRDSVTGHREMLLDTSKKQLKYRKVIDLLISVPALAVGTGWTKTIDFNFAAYGLNLPYAPAYQYRIKGYNGRWGKPSRPNPQSYTPSIYRYPYFHGLEYITKDNFYIDLYINNLDFPPAFSGYAYPAHTITLRLILTYDELETV